MRNRISCLIILGVLYLTPIIFGQSSQVYFKFQIKPDDNLAKLTQLISIDNVRDDTVYAYATETQFDNFKTLGYDYTVLPNPGTLYEPLDFDKGDILLDWNTYPSYEAYVDSMYDFQADYPNLCRIYSIGNSVERREILFAKVSANVDVEENEPEIMYSSTMHGDETTGFILMLKLIKHLLTNYDHDPQVANILDNTEVWINPLANPDGTYHGGNNSVFGAIRYNANDVDLNRNFPDPEEGDHPDGNNWQPETMTMMNFFDRHSFVISANFHGGAEVVNYPWDTWQRRHADDRWLISISREYADSAQNNSPSGYMTDLDNGITNGWDWYSISGGRQDYVTYWKGCRETTIELSHVKLLPENQLEAHWDYNRAALITYIEQAFYGIKGLVTNVNTGSPVAATISVIGHDIDGSEVYTDPDVGDYHRMIESGTYDLQFSALGYFPQTVYEVTVTYRNVTIVDLQMQPLPDEPVLEFVSHNADRVNAGDTANMLVTLVNNGGGDADDVVAELSTSDSYVSIIQSSSTFPVIEALGDTGTSQNNYIFTISSDCPNMHQIDFRLDITAAGGYSDSVFFDVIVGLVIEDFETGDFTAFPWESGGNRNWTISDHIIYEGEYSARSGNINHNQNTILSLDYDVSSQGTISFFMKVSSENTYDYLNFYIDDIRQDRWSGEVDWQSVSFNVSTGTHNFKWEYDKDGSVSNGSDCAWIDYIVFPERVPALQIITESLPPGNVDLPYYIQLENSGGTGEITWIDRDNDLDSTGLLLTSNGILIGIPVNEGTINFIARVEDTTGASDEQEFDILITGSFLPGDANGDGRVIGSDVTYLVNYFRGLVPPPEPFLAGDANGDCEVLGSDITYLINFFRGSGNPPLQGDCQIQLYKKIIETIKKNNSHSTQ